MPQSNSPVPPIVAEADALIRKVQQDFEAAADFYRDNDIDPAKVLSACEPFLGAQEQQELQRLIAQDQAEIQREIDENAARLRFSTPPASGGAPKRPRTMI